MKLERNENNTNIEVGDLVGFRGANNKECYSLVVRDISNYYLVNLTSGEIKFSDDSLWKLIKENDLYLVTKKDDLKLIY